MPLAINRYHMNDQGRPQHSDLQCLVVGATKSPEKNHSTMSSFNVSDSCRSIFCPCSDPPREESGSENRVKTYGHSCNFVSGWPLNLTTQTIDIRLR